MNDEELDGLAKEAWNDYMKAYRKANKDKIKRYNQKYWAKVALKAKETSQNALESTLGSEVV